MQNMYVRSKHVSDNVISLHAQCFGLKKPKGPRTDLEVKDLREAGFLFVPTLAHPVLSRTMTKRTAEVAELDIEVTVFNIPGVPSPERFRVPRSALMDDLKQMVSDFIMGVYNVRVYRSSFRLIQAGTHRPYYTRIGDPGSS